MMTKRCLTLFVTHFPEISKLIGKPRIAVKSVHMSFEIQRDGPKSRPGIQYLYKMKNGPCPLSFGFEVASMAGIPLEIVNRAKLKTLEKVRRNKYH